MSTCCDFVSWPKFLMDNSIKKTRKRELYQNNRFFYTNGGRSCFNFILRRLRRQHQSPVTLASTYARTPANTHTPLTPCGKPLSFPLVGNSLKHANLPPLLSKPLYSHTSSSSIICCYMFRCIAL